MEKAADTDTKLEKNYAHPLLEDTAGEEWMDGECRLGASPRPDRGSDPPPYGYRFRGRGLETPLNSTAQ